VGLELRSKVCDYVRQRAAVARARAAAAAEEGGGEGGERGEEAATAAATADLSSTAAAATAATAATSSYPSLFNVSALRINAQRHLVNLFRKHQLNKIFFLFPDPHFKAKNWRRRIVTPSACAEFAYVLRPGGRLYTITDVEDLGKWMAGVLDDSPMFRRLSEEELSGDAAAGLLFVATEEGQKVARNGGKTFRACYERLEAPRVLPE
jgi:tRNA (guanine-N(7)-)-methyltransferase